MDLTTALNEFSQLVRQTCIPDGWLTERMERKLEEVYGVMQAMMQESAEYLTRAQTAEAHVKALLAAIYEDNGEVQARHGTERAVADAVSMVQACLKERDSMPRPVANGHRYKETGEQ